jgi:methylated-DNA-[protein]-cysteine S-methyltransferase
MAAAAAPTPSVPAAGAPATGVLHRRVATPVGELIVAVTDVGVARVAFAVEDLDVVEAALDRRHAAGRSGAGSGTRTGTDTSALLDSAVRQLAEYFDGDRRTFDVPVDLTGLPPFRRAAVAAMTAIPYGTTSTYADLAAAAGNDRAVRAVGTACARNPLPILVPCHRVVRSDGTVGGFLGGVRVKLALQALEARHH